MCHWYWPAFVEVESSVVNASLVDVVAAAGRGEGRHHSLAIDWLATHFVDDPQILEDIVLRQEVVQLGSPH